MKPDTELFIRNRIKELDDAVNDTMLNPGSIKFKTVMTELNAYAIIMRMEFGEHASIRPKRQPF